MNNMQHKTIEGWINKASNQLQTARDYAQSPYRCSEAIQAAQQCVELSVKAILSLLNIKYRKAHEWAAEKEPFAAIAQQIQERKLTEKLASQYLDHTIPLPRLLLLMNFWGQFYLVSKYGFEAEHLASAQDLFQSDEAKLAVQHAEECYHAASALQHLDKEKLAVLLDERAP